MTKLVSSLQSILGVVLVAAAMVLSLPGIQVVRADEAVAAPNTATTAAGPMCSADSSSRATEVATMAELEAMLAEARAEQQREWAAKGWGPKEAAEAGEAVVLNGRGYNYRPPAAPAR